MQHGGYLGGPGHPWPVEPLRLDPGRPGRTGQDPVAGRRGHLQHRHRRTGRVLTSDRHLWQRYAEGGLDGRATAARAGRRPSAAPHPRASWPTTPARRQLEHLTGGQPALVMRELSWPTELRLSPPTVARRPRLVAGHDLKPPDRSFKVCHTTGARMPGRDLAGCTLTRPERAPLGAKGPRSVRHRTTPPACRCARAGARPRMAAGVRQRRRWFGSPCFQLRRQRRLSSPAAKPMRWPAAARHAGRRRVHTWLGRSIRRGAAALRPETSASWMHVERCSLRSSPARPSGGAAAALPIW